MDFILQNCCTSQSFTRKNSQCETQLCNPGCGSILLYKNTIRWDANDSLRYIGKSIVRWFAEMDWLSFLAAENYFKGRRLTFLASGLISMCIMNSGGACLSQTYLACTFVPNSAALYPTEIFTQRLASLKLFLFSPGLDMCMLIRLIFYVCCHLLLAIPRLCCY